MKILRIKNLENQNVDVVVSFNYNSSNDLAVSSLKKPHHLEVNLPVFIDGEHKEEEKLRYSFSNAMSYLSNKGYKNICLDINTASGIYSGTYLSILLQEELIEKKLNGNYYFLFNRESEKLDSIFMDLNMYLSSSVEETESMDIGILKDKINKYENENKKKGDAKTFCDYINKLMYDKNLRNVDVYTAAHIGSGTFTKIVSEKYNRLPKKETVLALAIGFKLDFEGAQKFAHAAGYHIGTNDKKDLIVTFCIENQIYDMDTVDDVFVEYGLPLLGEKVR